MSQFTEPTGVSFYPCLEPSGAVVGRCVFSDSEVLQNFVDVGGEVAYLQEAASDVYAARAWIFGFGFCFSTVRKPRDGIFEEFFLDGGWRVESGGGEWGLGGGGGRGAGRLGDGEEVVVVVGKR